MGILSQPQLRNQELACPWPTSIKKFFEQVGAVYQVHEHEPTVTLEQAAEKCHLETDCLVRGIVLGDEQGLIMAILPANRLLDFSALCELMQRNLQPVSADILRSVFRDCEPGSYPPVPSIYQLEPVMDQSVYKLPNIIFEPGSHEILIEMKLIDFQKLHPKLRTGQFSAELYSLSEMNENQSDVQAIVNKFTPRKIDECVGETFELPTLPTVAEEILKLRVDPDADAKKLAHIIEKDPSLAVQLMRWAKSPFYGYPGKVDSVESAISKVLGIDLVMNLALGIVVSKAMHVPVEGPLGLKAYWKFSLYVAYLVEKLASIIPVEKRPPRGSAYLAGLLHNIGHLILGEAFPPQFFFLNRYVMLNPHVPINKIEHHVLGVRHEQIGAWLMHVWDMPKEVIAAVKWHHQGEFVDEHGVFANLIFVAIRLLKTQDLGDASSVNLPPAFLESLGITEVEARAVYEDMAAHLSELDALAEQIN